MPLEPGSESPPPVDGAPAGSVDLPSGVDPAELMLGLRSENPALDDAPGSPAGVPPAHGSASSGGDVASGLEQEVAKAITTLSAVVSSDQAERFERWALEVFDFDPRRFDMGVAGVFQPVLDAFGNPLAKLKVRSLDGLRAWVIRELADDLARGAESKFREILPYPADVSEQEQKALHRIWFRKVVGGGVHELTLVPFHVAAKELSRPMLVHHPFGAPDRIGPPPDDGVVPEQVLWWRGAYFLVKPRAEDGIADRIAEGFPQKINPHTRRELDGKFEKTRGLLQAAIAKAEKNPDSTYSRILENTFQRDLAVIRQRSSFPYSQVQELAAHLRYLRNLKDQGSWEDQRPTDLDFPFTIRVPATPVRHDPEMSGFTRPVPGLSIWLAGQEMRLDGIDGIDGIDGLVRPGDEVYVTIGKISRRRSAGFVEIRYTRPDGTESAIFQGIDRRFTLGEVAALKTMAPGRAWKTDHPLFVDSYRSTTSIFSARRNLGTRLGGAGDPSIYLPGGILAGGGKFDYPTTLDRIVFRAGFGVTGQPLMVVELTAAIRERRVHPDQESGAGQDLYVEVVNPALTADSIGGMSRSINVYWELEDLWDLSGAVTYPGEILADTKLPAPLRTTIGKGRHLTPGGGEVQVTKGTKITYRVGKWPRLAGSESGVFVVVRAPLVDGTGHAYRLIDTGKKIDELDGIIKTLNKRQERDNRRVPLAGSAPERHPIRAGGSGGVAPDLPEVPGQAWRLPPSFVGSYHITASLGRPKSNFRKLDVKFAGRPVYIPQAVAVDGDSFVFPADIEEVRLELGYDSTGRSAAFVELPAENSPTGETLYLKLEPAPTADDIESLRRRALWVPQNQWDLSDAEDFEDVMGVKNLLPHSLLISVGTEGALGGAKVKVTAGTDVTFRVGKWSRQVGPEFVTGVFVVVKAPLVGGTGHAYKIINTKKTLDEFEALIKDLQDRQERRNMRILRAEWAPEPTRQRPSAGDGPGAGGGSSLPGGAAAFEW
ncbi:hypothetical protein, partial [Micromonospora sp. NPDC047730]|uniref:hypothetical protein n=1 Tax=Micromonospora sp. NPDC047730 TaxID=3364253 RepID=UPI0037194CD2